MPRVGLDQEKVLTAAEELVDEEGPEGLTLARLASRLQVRTPSLYNHISGLEPLQRNLAVRGFGLLAAKMRAAATGLAGFDALTAIAEAYRAFAHEHPGLYALMLRVRDDSPAQSAAAQEVVDVVVAVLRGYGLHGEAAIHATRCLRSAIHGFVSLEVAGGFGLPYDLDESFRCLIRMLDEGLRRSGLRS